MRRIRFVRQVTIGAVTGPSDCPDRLAFAVGEVLSLNEASAERFVRLGEAVYEPETAAAPEAVYEPEPDVLPEWSAEDAAADIGEDAVVPPRRRRGRPRRDE